MKRTKVSSGTISYDEAHRYYRDAKEILKPAKIEYNRYTEAKPVQESAGWHI
jgi:hypothetical protein